MIAELVPGVHDQFGFGMLTRPDDSEEPYKKREPSASNQLDTRAVLERERAS